MESNLINETYASLKSLNLVNTKALPSLKATNHIPKTSLAHALSLKNLQGKTFSLLASTLPSPTSSSSFIQLPTLITTMTSDHLIHFLLLFLLLPSPSLSQSACMNSCGSIPIYYPFGTGPGCGSSIFQPYVTCDQGQLIFTTNTGSYPVQSVDYTNQILTVTDPSMSTCSSMNTSNGFSLDLDAPFTFVDGDIFALLDCYNSSSPLYTSNGTDVPLCDTSDAAICSRLYTCPSISQLNEPVSTCCIYTPLDLGPAFQMNLQMLQCTSYAGIYSFDANEDNPQLWKFGIMLKYRFSVDDGYPSNCANCQNSNGVCGYSGPNNAFSCNCANGMNSSTTCYSPFASLGGGRRVPLPIGFGLVISFCWAMALILL